MRPCTKRRYRDKVAALMAIANIDANGEDRDGKTPQRAYSCPFCGGWHLSSRASHFGGPS